MFGELLPNQILPPPGFPNIDDPMLGFEEIDTIVSRYEKLGDPNVRYGLYSTDWSFIGIHSLDELIFSLRRLCGVLEASKDGRSLRQTLKSDARYQLVMKWGKYKDDIKHLNYSFFPSENGKSGKFNMIYFPGFTNSPLSLLMQQKKPCNAEAIKWFLKNAHLPKEAKRELQSYLDEVGSENTQSC